MTKIRNKSEYPDDPETFEQLSRSWIRTINRLRKEAYSLTGDQDVADDLVQVVLEEALRDVASGKESLHLGPWLSGKLTSAYREHSPHLH